VRTFNRAMRDIEKMSKRKRLESSGVKGRRHNKMTGNGKSYTQIFQAQRLEYFKKRIEEIRGKLLDDPWDFNFDAEIMLLKNANIEEVEIIGQAMKEVCGRVSKGTCALRGGECNSHLSRSASLRG
jgi:hypothetical protein